MISQAFYIGHGTASLMLDGTARPRADDEMGFDVGVREVL